MPITVWSGPYLYKAWRWLPIIIKYILIFPGFLIA
jgi:hypothetical protein